MEKETCKKIPIHEFEKEVSNAIDHLITEFGGELSYTYVLRPECVAKISSAAVRILLEDDK